MHKHIHATRTGRTACGSGMEAKHAKRQHAERVGVPHGTGKATRSSIFAGLIGLWSSLILMTPSLAWRAVAGNPIDSLQPGHWYEVPNSRLRSVAPATPPGDFSCVINCWSGGVYDAKRDRFIVWGGGHGSYAGNEIYAFDINTLKWQRLTNPSPYYPPRIPSPSTNPDGTPVSVHSYDGLEYLPNVDKFWAHGGSRWYDGAGITLTWLFDFSTLRWTRKADSPPGWCGGLENASAYDPVSGRVFVGGTASCTPLIEYDPLTDTWTPRGDGNSFLDIGLTAAIDSKRRKFVAIGVGKVFVVDLKTTGTLTKGAATTTGATSILNTYAPGLVYDPVSDRLVAWDAWSGGASVYTLNPDTLVWTKVQPPATNTVAPPGAGDYNNGTYGRFQYVPSKNVFIAVNHVDKNVYIYRLSTTDFQPHHPTILSPRLPRQIQR